MTPKSEAATGAAERLWARVAGGASAPGEVAASAAQVCRVLRLELGRWIGAEGYQALLDRALERARIEHPSLVGLPCVDKDEAAVLAAVQEHGAEEVAAGMVALVAGLIRLLGRIIGEEMVVHLVEQIGTPSPRGVVSVHSKGGHGG